MEGSRRGRIASGWHLLGVSWNFLRARPSLFAFPALSALLVAIAALAIFTPVLYVTHASSSKLDLLIAVAATAIPATIATTFCNVAFIVMVQAHLRGESPTFQDGLRAARSRLAVIVRWSLLTVAIGAILRAISQIPGGEVVGGAVNWLGGLAWSLATYFVIPVIVVEDAGVIDGVKRSASVFKQRWGESITGDFTVGAVFGLLMVPGILCLASGWIAFGAGAPAAGIALLLIGLVLTAPLLAMSSAVTQMFQLVLFCETLDGTPPAPFTTEDTSAAFRRRTSFWRR